MTTTDLQTLRVGFADKVIAINSDAPEVLAGARHHFRAMLIENFEESAIIASLEVHREAEGYRIELAGDEYSAADNFSVDIAETLNGLKHRVAAQFMRARNDLLWLHAAAVARDGSAVIITGSWGKGKSTLAAGLCARGFRFLSDDLAPYNPVTKRVLPFPETLSMRLDPGMEMPSHRVPKLKKTAIALQNEAICKESMPVGALVLPDFSHGASAQLTLRPPAHAVLRLLENCLNFSQHQEAAVRHLCSLAQRAPAFALRFGCDQAAIELLEGVLTGEPLGQNSRQVENRSQ